MDTVISERQAASFHDAVLFAVRRKRITDSAAQEILTHVVIALSHGNVLEASTYMDRTIESLNDANGT